MKKTQEMVLLERICRDPGYLDDLFMMPLIPGEEVTLLRMMQLLRGSTPFGPRGLLKQELETRFQEMLQNNLSHFLN